MKCPKCNNKKNIIKYGFYNGVQRYKCKNCNRLFKSEKNYAIKTKKEKDFVQALYNLLNIRPEEISDRYKNLDIAPIIYEDSLKNAPDDIAVIIKNCSWENHKRISCRNPKALLCLCGKEIRVVILKSSETFNIYDKKVRIGLNHKQDAIVTKNGRKHLERI